MSTLSTATQIKTTTTWAMRSFGDHPRDTRGTHPKVLRYVVPAYADVAGVTPYAPPAEPLSLDIAALVHVTADGELVHSDRAEITLAVVRVGDTLPEHTDPGSGPRLLGPHPYRRDTWVYFLDSCALLGPGSIYDHEFHPREVQR